jgi:hypothetical protein
MCVLVMTITSAVHMQPACHLILSFSLSLIGKWKQASLSHTSLHFSSLENPLKWTTAGAGVQ